MFSVAPSETLTPLGGCMQGLVGQLLLHVPPAQLLPSNIYVPKP